MPGLIGKKLGMTSIFDADRKSVACTLIQIEPNVVTQIKTLDKDGYEAVQLAYGERKLKNVTDPLIGHLKKAGVEEGKHIFQEFDYKPSAVKLGQELKVDALKEGASIKIVGTSKGKGFQGVVKRHGFAGVGGQTHGQHNRLRHPGSMGACSYPSRVFKGKKLGGQMGNDRVKIKGLKVLRVMLEDNLLVVSGSIPGANNSYVTVYF